MNELVSIIMPSYNTADYIAESIQSVINQTYSNWELLIVDDCSTDNSIDIIEAFNDPRIRLLMNPKNAGAAISRNYALREARGRWIAFLDSDDLWYPEKLEKQVKFMETNNYAFTFTDYRICINDVMQPYVYYAPNVIDKWKMYNYCYFSTITVMYDKNIVGLIQINDLKKNNDYAMWLKVVEKANAYRLPECLSIYNKHEGSISSGNKLKLIKWHYLLFNKGMEFGPLLSAIFTINNLFHGVIKKIKYKKQVREV